MPATNDGPRTRSDGTVETSVRLTAAFLAGLAGTLALSGLGVTGSMDAPYLFLFPPILVVAVTLGWRESVAATLAVAAALHLFAAAFSVPWVGWLHTALFCVNGVGLAILCRSHERSVGRERRRATDRADRARFSQLMSSNLLGMVVGTPDGHIAEANDAFLDIVGRGRYELPTLRLEAMTPPDSRPADREAVAQLRRNGVAPPYEKSFRQPDGTLVPVVVHPVLISRDPDTVMAVVINLSRGRQLEADLRDQAERLRQADRRKNEFLAMLGHELRNPLAPIHNAVEILRSPAADTPAERHRALRIIADQVNVLIRLVDDLLDAARVQQGKVRLRAEPCDLSETIAAAGEAAKPLLSGRRLHLFVHVPEEPLWAVADARRINQLVANLLSNAAKYTEPGGKVWLTLERDPDDPVGHVLIRVQDTGVGIDPLFLPRVWDLFAQDHPPDALDRAGGGLGIGLTLVRSFAELHGGTAAVRSEGPGQGTEFVVRLPYRPAGWVARPLSDSEPPPTSDPRRILIVDDNFAVAEAQAMMLKTDGHTVSVAHDGIGALAIESEFRPDVVLLDIGLPGMDGYEVARRLRARGTSALLVAVTGYGGDADREAGRAAGFDHYLVKPADPKQLRRLLAAAPARSREVPAA